MLSRCRHSLHGHQRDDAVEGRDHAELDPTVVRAADEAAEERVSCEVTLREVEVNLTQHGLALSSRHDLQERR